MEAQGFFSMLDRGNIFFESTRAEKCKRIAQLGCDLFIDDLEEVFDDAAFPSATRRLLFYSGPPPLPHGNFQVLTTWKEIGNAVFRSD